MTAVDCWHRNSPISWVSYLGPVMPELHRYFWDSNAINHQIHKLDPTLELHWYLETFSLEMVRFYCPGQPYFNVTVTITPLIYFLFSVSAFDAAMPVLNRTETFVWNCVNVHRMCDTDVGGVAGAGGRVRAGTVIILADNWHTHVVDPQFRSIWLTGGFTIEHHQAHR